MAERERSPEVAAAEDAAQAAYQEWGRLRDRAVTLRIRAAREACAVQLNRAAAVVLDDRASSQERARALSLAYDAITAVRQADMAGDMS